MKNKFKLVCYLVVICMVLSSNVVGAEPKSVPGGPHLQPNQNISFSRWLTFDDMEAQLLKLEKQSKGRLEVEVAGETTHGVPIYLAKFGEANENKPRILVQSQMHGDETPHTIAAMDLIKTLATSGNKEVLDILENVTVWFVPMLNPEGAMYEIDGEWWPVRQNNQEWTPEEWGLDPDTPSPYRHSTSPLGFDINRDFHPDFSFRLDNENINIKEFIRKYRGVDRLMYPDHGMCDCCDPEQWYGVPGFFVTPEARTMAKIFEEIKPDLVIDLHQLEANQTIEGTDDLITLWITAEGVCEKNGYTDPVTGKHYSVDEESLKLGKQVNYLVYEKLNEKGKSHFGNIARYQDLRTIGMGMSSYQLNGAAIMLYEFRGFATQTTGQAASGFAIEQAYTGMYETLKGFSTGEVYEIDEELYYTEIPYWGDRKSVV